MKYFVGLSLSMASTIESGVAVIDEDRNIIFIDKLFKMRDVEHFFNNFSSLADSEIAVSLPWDNSLLEGKWRILSKPYQMVNTSEIMPNVGNWTQRYSTRGCEFLKGLKNKCCDISRFELYLTRQKMNLASYYKERTPADCKFLQNVLKTEHGLNSIPSNMMPMAQLEAIVGALLVMKKNKNPEKIDTLFKFSDLNVINLV